MHMQNPIFIPGPTNIPDRVRKAVDIATMDHRSGDFAGIIQPALAAVKQVLKTQTGEIAVFPGSGTLGWEAAISNTLALGDKVLAAQQGMFSAKWIDMCERHGLDMVVHDVTWGMACPVTAYAQTLAADTGHEIKAVLVTHNETATGVVSDVAAVRAAMDAVDHPALLLVDGVSSIGSMDFRMDEWGVDLAVTGSQKGFMLPAGLAIVGVSQKALGLMGRPTLPRYYYDIPDMINNLGDSGYPYTPVVGMLNGLGIAAGMLLEEGLEAVFARHRHIANGVRAAVHAWELEICAVDASTYSDSVTAIVLPEGIDGNALTAHAADRYGVSFGGGLGQLSGKVFRIGHLGSLTEAMALLAVATAEMAMADLGIDLQPGAGVAAAQAVYRQGV